MAGSIEAMMSNDPALIQRPVKPVEREVILTAGPYEFPAVVSVAPNGIRNFLVELPRDWRHASHMVMDEQRYEFRMFGAGVVLAAPC